MNLSISEKIVARRVLKWLRETALSGDDPSLAIWLEEQAEQLKISLEIERIYKKPPSTGARIINARRTRPKRIN